MASPALPLPTCVPHFPFFKMKRLQEKGSKNLHVLLLFYSVVLRPTPAKSILTFFKLLKPAFQLDPSRSLFPLAVGNSKALLLRDFICLLLTADSEPCHLRGSLGSLKRLKGQTDSVENSVEEETRETLIIMAPWDLQRGMTRAGPFTTARSKVRSGMWTMLVTPGRCRRVTTHVQSLLS